MTPLQLDRDGIAARIPHSGTMCLLERLDTWDAQHIACSTATHRLSDNPLRTADGLMAPCAIEYAAQAMALHGGLLAKEGQEASAGYLASVRNVQFGQARLDTVDGDLQVQAHRLSGDERQVLYEFRVGDAGGRMLAQGRAVVVLNTPLSTEDLA